MNISTYFYQAKNFVNGTMSDLIHNRVPLAGRFMCHLPHHMQSDPRVAAIIMLSTTAIFSLMSHTMVKWADRRIMSHLEDLSPDAAHIKPYCLFIFFGAAIFWANRQVLELAKYRLALPYQVALVVGAIAIRTMHLFIVSIKQEYDSLYNAPTSYRTP